MPRKHDQHTVKMVQKSHSQPPDMYETLQTMGYLPYQLMQDFIQQQCVVSFNTIQGMPNSFESAFCLKGLNQRSTQSHLTLEKRRNKTPRRINVRHVYLHSVDVYGKLVWLIYQNYIKILFGEYVPGINPHFQLSNHLNHHPPKSHDFFGGRFHPRNPSEVGRETIIT